MEQALIIDSDQSGGRIANLGHYEIRVDQPLPELRTPTASAYVAIDRESPGLSLYALICNPEMPPRLDVLETLRGIHLEAMLSPVHFGIVEWPLAARRCLAIIYDRPAGGPFVLAPDRPGAPIAEDELAHGVMPPLVAAMQEFFSSGATHRAIRTTNLYFRDAARRLPVLGDCCTTPPGLTQPLIYESIESGLASPWGRGNGTPADDLYSLGVTLVMLLLGRNPVAGIPDERLLIDKINRGSYAAIVGSERIPPGMVEPVRGLLTDDPKDRWSIQDLELWVQGRRLTPKQPTLPKRSTRAFEFAGESYFTARSLGLAFAQKPAAAAGAFNSAEFAVWMQRSLADAERNKALAAALSEAHDSGASGHEERLTARVVTALDPLAPVRYKDFAAAVDGFGTALAGAFRGQGSVATIAEAVSGRLPVFWFSVQQPGLHPEQVPILKSLERLRFLLENRRLGFGPERLLYETNPSIHCLSPLIEAQYVIGAAGVLPAMETALQNQSGDELQIDRHLAAFIAARFKMVTSDWFTDLASQQPAARAIGALRILAKLQATTGPLRVPKLAQRLSRQLAGAVEGIRNRPKRLQVLNAIPAAAERGSLPEMLALVDNHADMQRDAAGFTAAAQEYSRIERALHDLRADGTRRPERAALLGAQIAAATASFLAWAAALALLVIVG